MVTLKRGNWEPATKRPHGEGRSDLIEDGFVHCSITVTRAFGSLIRVE
jgi:hypothetical protein